LVVGIGNELGYESWFLGLNPLTMTNDLTRGSD